MPKRDTTHLSRFKLHWRAKLIKYGVGVTITLSNKAISLKAEHQAHYLKDTGSNPNNRNFLWGRIMKTIYLILIIHTVSWIFTLPVFAGSYYCNNCPDGYYDRGTGRGLYDRGGYLRHQPSNSGSLRSYGSYEIYQTPRYYMPRRYYRSNSRILQQIYR
jgi:hypothetical protein